MFVLKKNRNYKWPVTIQVPADGGKYEDVSLEVTYKFLSEDEVKKVLEGNRYDSDICKKIVLDIDGVYMEDGSKAKVEDVLSIPKASTTIARAFLEAHGVILVKN